MPCFSETATRQGVELVRQIVKRRFGRSQGKPNIRAATRAASPAPLESPRWETDKRLLSTVVCGKGGYGSKWQEQTFNRLCVLLERLEPGSTKKLVGAIRSPRAVEEVSRILRKSDWAELPDGQETAFIEQRLDRWAMQKLDEFKRWAVKQGHNKWRVWVSLQRILAPLACYARTFGIERGWHELAQREKRDFIRCGIAREKITLRVDPAHVRAIGRFPPGETQHDQELKDIIEMTGGPDTEENRRAIEKAWAWAGVW